ncbi:MAG: type III pantothenate kinase [Lachnospiraceae bacterium]|nr:type III pantothenate kinase [Lachnospiraceae bacterium]
MLLAIGISNTFTEIGILDGSRITARDRVSSQGERTPLEYSVLFSSFMEMNGIRKSDIDGAILSSVVPSLTSAVVKAVERAAGVNPLIVGPGVKSGLRIRIDDPRQLGADIAARAVGGISRYGSPLLLINMGSATTISVIDGSGAFTGTVIVPGAGLSLNALIDGTSQLPGIDLSAPRKVIGTNTVDSMKSGAVFGQAALIDGLAERILAELGEEARIVAAGTYASAIIPHCKKKIQLDDELLFLGLRLIFEKNSSGFSPRDSVQR